ncbi:MAG: hypothetical protein A3J83_08455 [Elusimicrobia bacterium RIFOXYA2_FULL_40_6]|nr:MAG: hypothetical protein A3J83_08455 [Elusimicrobia bacterium RIFOXYA2_FULL_40_6]
MIYEIIFYTNQRGDSPVDEFLDSLQIKTRAKVEKWLQRLQEYGPNLPRPFSDTLRDKIRELRVSHGGLEIRLLYFFWHDRAIIVAHGFLKKTREVSEQDIERAVRVKNDFLLRHGG